MHFHRVIEAGSRGFGRGRSKTHATPAGDGTRSCANSVGARGVTSTADTLRTSASGRPLSGQFGRSQ
jgi:hypothetical protein